MKCGVSRGLKAAGLAALTAAALLGGCGTPSEPAQLMLPAGDALQLRAWIPEALKGNVAVAPVNGGAATGKWWGSKIANEAMQAALEDSLRSTGMLAQRPAQARYKLELTLAELEQPWVGLDIKVAATLDWRLSDQRSGETLYQRRLRSLHTTDFGQAMLDQNERTRIANEAVVRKAINTVLRELIELRY
ncbi:hypothetical protein RQP53_09575 [Paucibacter sp. APW11]|uniref:ABC-type transport auxiliary lipoprotein component domain-containing protein n=1 Tax=Roseateles aquae TaxID=3077235 RepID=A0ABU3PAG3_9BURK|nr:hypothetical protein [Paucibacter sp. APW11]MDT8999515.1 hypothetical protein [Paucibacter sp. APW11]